MRIRYKRGVAVGAALGVAAAGVMALSGEATLAGTSGGNGPSGEPAATSSQSSTGVKGRFSLVMMIHTRSSSFGDLAGVTPWNGVRTEGASFEYRSIPCRGNAPVNNIASDLPSYGTRVRGSRAPSSMRAHPFGFKLRKNRNGKWEMLGGIRFTVCHLRPGPTPSNDPVADTEKPYINVGFRARFRRESPELLRWEGRFRLNGGSQRYNDLSGSGTIAGYFFCFAPEGCVAHGGKYLDGQFVMQGSYRDPTPDLAGG